jgi:nucleolar protein 12
VEEVKETAAPTVSEPASVASPSKRKREDEPVEAEVSSRRGKKGKKGKKDAEPVVEAAVAVEEPTVPAAEEDINMDQASDAEIDDSNSADEDDEFVHESKKSASGEKDRGKKQKKQKFVPEEESKSDRDRRTIFIGNLPVETAKSKVSLTISPLTS